VSDNQNFEQWFNELEGYTSRAERFYEDIELHDPQRIKDWLLAAYNQGIRDANPNSVFRKLYPNLPAPSTYIQPKRTCSRCGLSLECVMGYVCSDSHCPTFLKPFC
jgi:hypothetical protein